MNHLSSSMWSDKLYLEALAAGLYVGVGLLLELDGRSELLCCRVWIQRGLGGGAALSLLHGEAWFGCCP